MQMIQSPKFADSTEKVGLNLDIVPMINLVLSPMLCYIWSRELMM